MISEVARKVIGENIEDNRPKNTTLHHTKIDRFQAIATLYRLRPTPKVVPEPMRRYAVPL